MQMAGWCLMQPRPLWEMVEIVGIRSQHPPPLHELESRYLCYESIVQKVPYFED
jgi:hypothetical protein